MEPNIVVPDALDLPVIHQSNALIRSCYTISLQEKRLLMLAITTLDPKKFPAANEQLSATVTSDMWTKYFPSQNPYKDMQAAADGLGERRVKIYNEHSKEHQTLSYAWCDLIAYSKYEGKVTLRFTRELTVHLCGLNENYTRYKLINSASLKSPYAIRLYELINQFRSTKVLNIKLEDFRKIMDLQKTYKQTAELIRAVVKPAIKQINSLTDLQVKFEAKKNGRSIALLHFKIEKIRQKQPDLFDL